MSWERDPLLAKARLFFEHAFSAPRDHFTFGLWCSLGLEVLARAAVASVSPTLLAEPDNDHRYLLHALNRGSDRVPRKSVSATQVFALCRTLFPDFSEHEKAANALANRRNEELHSGAGAFAEYSASQWLRGFYGAAKVLAQALGESLVGLFGEDEANAAEEMMTANQNDVRQRVESTIAAHRKVFEGRSIEERGTAVKSAKEQGDRLFLQRHHRVSCPACGCTATVQGKLFGKENITHDDRAIVVKQSVSPTNFRCPACGLKLEGYCELEAARLGGPYTRTSTYSPEEYYGLIDPDDADELRPYIENYLENLQEYDNE